MRQRYKGRTVFVASGNAGTALERKLQNVDLNVKDHAAVIQFCQDNDIAFVLDWSWSALVAGMVDDLTTAGIKAWGPAYCAQPKVKAFAKILW